MLKRLMVPILPGFARERPCGPTIPSGLYKAFEEFASAGCRFYYEERCCSVVKNPKVYWIEGKRKENRFKPARICLSDRNKDLSTVPADTERPGA